MLETWQYIRLPAASPGTVPAQNFGFPSTGHVCLSCVTFQLTWNNFWGLLRGSLGSLSTCCDPWAFVTRGVYLASLACRELLRGRLGIPLGTSAA
eukprot:6254844-Pyramimonas_sp.AAC.1